MGDIQVNINSTKFSLGDGEDIDGVGLAKPAAPKPGSEGNQMSQNRKHLSQHSATDRARFDEQLRMAMLAIVVAQGKAVTIPTDHADAIWETHILKVQIVEINGKRCIELAAEAVAPLIVHASANDLPA